VYGTTVEVRCDGEPVGTVPLSDADITGGRVVLGIFTERNAAAYGPYAVAFIDVKIRRIVR
jgi:hypothetical protein